MAIIGKFTKDGEGFTGSIETLTLKATIRITPVERKNSDNQPDYRVEHVTSDFTSDIGAAWRKKNDKGSQWLSLSIDDPSFPGKLNCNLFKTGIEHGYELVWERARPRD